MSKHLKIIGLGRCVIGHLAKYFNTQQSNNVFFKHHYLLNYATCLNSSYSQKDLLSLNNPSCTPSIPDQLQCLEEMDQYDLCAIELFPPSNLYKHNSNNIFACFESFTDQLKAIGFENITMNPNEIDEEPENYAKLIEQLVTKIRAINHNIKIILVNGELTKDSDRPNIGSPRLHAILNALKTSPLLTHDFITLLDMNDLINILQSEHKTFFERAFPYIYISHTHDLQVRGVYRDCKHTTTSIRMNFTKDFCNKINTFGLDTPNIDCFNEQISNSTISFQERANTYLNEENSHDDISFTFKDPKKLSLYISYALEVQHYLSYAIVKQYIIDFSKIHPLRGEDLKRYFYHIRTLSAFIYETKSPMLKELCHINFSILEMSHEEIEPYVNFALLWITNTYLSCLSLIEHATKDEKTHFDLFLYKLSNHHYLQCYNPIQKILSDSLKIIGD